MEGRRLPPCPACGLLGVGRTPTFVRTRGPVEQFFDLRFGHRGGRYVRAVFLGDQLLPLLLLALGAAMVVGNGLALVRPPAAAKRRDGDLAKAPVARSLVMIGIGLIAAIWAVATLVT